MECFVVHKDEIEGRIDPFYYKPVIFKVKKNIQKKGTSYLKDFIEEIYRYPTFYNISYKENGIRVIKGENISEDGEIDKNQKFDSIDLKTHFKFKKTHLKKGDLVFTVRGVIGKVGYYDFYDEGNINANVIKIRIKKNQNPKFFWIYLNSKIGQSFIQTLSSGQVQKTITVPDIEKIPIPKLNIETQNQIVQLMDNTYNIKKQKEAEAQQLLDSINDYVFSELGIKIPELKDQMTFAVYADDVKGGRFDPYYYQPKFEEVEKAIKNGKYEVRKLKEIVKRLVSGQRPKGGVRQIDKGIPSLGGEHILSDGTIATTDLKFIPIEFHNKQSKSKVRKRDILIVKDGATTGKVGIIPEDYPFEEANINEHVFLLRVKEDINPFYIFSVLKSQLGQIQINREVTGGTIMGIVREAIENIKIPLPPLEIQNKIAEEVKRRMQKAEQLQKEAKEILEKAKQEVENIILNGENNED